jgi:carbon-monoxide dehydrogenase medium subunit
MYAPSFDYFRAGSIREAHELLRRHPGAKLLAGGHSLIPLLKFRLAAPPALIDIGRIAELKGIVKTDGALRIGALTTHAELASSSVLKAGCPMLAEAAAQIGDQQVRNCGTIGGNLAHADPASDLPTVLVALGARIVSAGPQGERRIPAGDFFRGMMTTALGDGEILTAVELDERTPDQGMAYAKFPHPASRYAVVGAAAAVRVTDRACIDARVAIGGLLPVATRARAVETALVGVPTSQNTIQKAAEQVSGALGSEVLEDLFASADYRKAMAVVYVKRALTAAFDRATA